MLVQQSLDRPQANSIALGALRCNFKFEYSGQQLRGDARVLIRNGNLHTGRISAQLESQLRTRPGNCFAGVANNIQKYLANLARISLNLAITVTRDVKVDPLLANHRR